MKGLLTGVSPSNWGYPLLFDPKPKSDPRDLFDREEELSRLKFGINFPITLLLGIRRSGKSSLVKVLMREVEGVWVYLDLRKFEVKSYITYSDLVKELEGALNGVPERLRRMLQGIRGISFSGVEVRLSWGGKERVELVDILERLSEIGEREGRRVIIVIDESQELRKLRGYNLLNPLAYAYDNLRLSFILTGSEVGMVYRFLRLDEPSSPLFGRAMTEVHIAPFPRDKALEFLRRGFDEVGIDVREEFLNEAVDNLGGIPGWLTYYGFYYMQERDHGKALSRAIDTGVSLIREEFRNFLRGREGAKERYRVIMSTCRDGCTWSDVKRALEVREGRSIDDKAVATLLKNLVDASFLVKEGNVYRPSDPLIRRAFKPAKLN